MRAPTGVYEQIRAELVRNEEAAREAFVHAPLGKASAEIAAYHRALAARQNFECWVVPLEEQVSA